MSYDFDEKKKLVGLTNKSIVVLTKKKFATNRV